MFSESQVEKFRRDGFILGEQVLSPAEVDVLRDELERVIREGETDTPADRPRPTRISNLSGKDDAPVWQIVNIWQASGPYRDLAFNARITDAAAKLFGAQQLRVWHDQIQYKPAATGGVNGWHQDSPLWPPLTPKDQQISAWIALDDVAEDNGCMSMVPGSHKWGPQMPELAKIEAFNALPKSFQGHAVERVLCPVKAGHVHFHHALTWHGSHENRSGRPRRAIAVHYMTERTRFDASGEHIVKPYIEVADGEPIAGDAFPLVYDGQPVTQPA